MTGEPPLHCSVTVVPISLRRSCRHLNPDRTCFSKYTAVEHCKYASLYVFCIEDAAVAAERIILESL